MAAPLGPERVRITTRSAVLAVAMLGLTLLGLRVLVASARVLGWIAVAAAIAGLLYPLVSIVSRRIPRALAVAAVAISALALFGGTSYAIVDSVVREMNVLQREAPRKAAELERSGRFAEAAREFELAERTRKFVEDVPERLRGGTAADAIRAAATRGVAFLATGVLTLFFLLHGPKLAEGAARQVHNPRRREQLERVGAAAYRRAFGYAGGTLAMAALAGGTGYVLARWGEVPGPAPLAVWLALWDAVPLVGAVIGALPIVVLAAIADPQRGLALAVAFGAYQLVEVFALQRRLEARTLRLGPFITTLAAFGGLELYGIGGALLAILSAAIGAAVFDELATGSTDGMERGSDKHGPRMDEALKGDDLNTRAEEFRREEGPVDDEPERADRAGRADVEQEQPGVLDDADAEARSDLARFIEPSAFPARPAELLEGAVGRFAPDWVIQKLRSLPDGVYDNTQQIWTALGGAVEEKRA